MSLVFLVSGPLARAETIVGEGLTPYGMAVDRSGDVFVADSSNNRVLVYKPNGTGGYTHSVVDDTGLNQPLSVAVGGSGDVFIADYGNNRVVVDKPNGSGGYTQGVVDTGVSFPKGVAVDGSGDVFIADAGHNRVVVDKPNSSGGYTRTADHLPRPGQPRGRHPDPL